MLCTEEHKDYNRFLSETMKVRRHWSNVFKIKKKKSQPASGFYIQPKNHLIMKAK
jgi:hypothetical protein